MPNYFIPHDFFTTDPIINITPKQCKTILQRLDDHYLGSNNQPLLVIKEMQELEFTENGVNMVFDMPAQYVYYTYDEEAQQLLFRSNLSNINEEFEFGHTLSMILEREVKTFELYYGDYGFCTEMSVFQYGERTKFYNAY